MVNTKPIEKSRIEARVTTEQKKLLVRAAAVSGMPLAQFIKTSLLEKASQAIQEHDILQLCLEDQQQLADHLINPPETPPNFKKLMNWRKQQEKHG